MPGKGQPAGSVVAALRSIDVFFRSIPLQYCLIGGLAVQIRGEPRFTRDIDICVVVTLEKSQQIIKHILSRFVPQVSGAEQLALETQILPVVIEGIDVDVAIGLTGFEQSVIVHASLEQLAEGLLIPVCSANDLIIYKCIAGRAKDLHDISTVIERNLGKLDVAYIRQILQEFEAALATDQLLSVFEEEFTAVSVRSPP